MELSIHDLSKIYPNGVKALNDVTLTIPNGLFGLLGPNGAGKSTLMRILATIQDADQGTITLDELDVLRDKHEVRKILGYLPQEFGVYPKTSARAMLDHIATLKGVSNRGERRELVDAMLNRVNLFDKRNKHISGFSGGMKQRFGIAQALLCDPKLIIVDEPTAGLDPGERNRFYNLLSEIGENKIVLLSTHIVQDVKELCPLMAIIHNGALVYSGSPSDAEQALEGKIWQKSVEKSELPRYSSQFTLLSTKLVAGRPLIHLFSESQPESGFLQVVPDLEDVFFMKINFNHLAVA